MTVSRQLKWQKGQARRGNCRQCGRPRAKGSKSMCDKCLQLMRDRARIRLGLQAWRPGGSGRPPADADPISILLVKKQRIAAEIAKLRTRIHNLGERRRYHVAEMSLLNQTIVQIKRSRNKSD